MDSNIIDGMPAGEPSEPSPFDYVRQADAAAANNHKRLAIHLYIAAFELENVSTMVPSAPVLEGMHRAWKLACEMQDKPCAEMLFTELAPFSSPEQVESRVHQLQEMAVTQLKEMGVPEDHIQRMSIIHSPDATAAGADPDFVSKFRDMLRTSSTVDDVLGNDASDESAEYAPVIPQWGREHDDDAEPKDYDDLVGFDQVMTQMRVYGFEAGGGEEYRQFVQETSEFHGLEGLSLYDPFLFYGPSRDDVYEFAEATAGEIGNPVITLHVRTDEDGLWTIRLSGPFRRGLFGVSDPTDVPTPCTFVIENIDILQDFIHASIRNEMMNPDVGPDHHMHAYGEILGYIHTILQKRDVFPILTSLDDVELTPQFDELFDRVQRIEVGYPTLDERKQLWSHFAEGHGSFSNIDIDELSRLSEGISRHDMIVAGRSAVRDAYQDSLTNSEYRYVDIKDVLFEMVPFISQQDGASYTAIEDAAVEAFVDELDGFTFAGDDEDSEAGE